MTPHLPGSRDEYPWADPALKQRLLRDPAGYLKDRGVNLPPNLPPHVVAEVVRVTALLWTAGQIVPQDRFWIDPADEGVLFGRGVWESTRTVNGVPWLWDLHLNRLKKTAELLDIPLAPERLPTAQQVRDFVGVLTTQDVLIRLNVTAGRPGKQGAVWMTAALRPASTTSVRLQTTPLPVPKDQPYLMWKTFQYATRLQVGRKATKDGFDSSLLYDADDNLLEAAHANLFVRFGDGWATPPTAGGGLLPGTVREFLLTNSPVKIQERAIPRASLSEAREVFVTNSNVGIVPVTQIDERSFPIGNETQDLMRWVNS
jgi:4-amino-4-deoxychorismate lyase